VKREPLHCNLFIEDTIEQCCWPCHLDPPKNGVEVHGNFQLIRPPRGGLRSAMIEYVGVCCLVHSKITSITIVEQI